jgi:hypothetical protein
LQRHAVALRKAGAGKACPIGTDRAGASHQYVYLISNPNVRGWLVATRISEGMV